MEYIVITISFFIIINLLIKVNKIEARVKRMQFTLDQVIKRFGLLENPIPDHPINDELRKLIKEDKDEIAIKKAIEVFGLSYQEGYYYIKSLKSKDG